MIGIGNQNLVIRKPSMHDMRWEAEQTEETFILQHVLIQPLMPSTDVGLSGEQSNMQTLIVHVTNQQSDKPVTVGCTFTYADCEYTVTSITPPIMSKNMVAYNPYAWSFTAHARTK